MIARVRALLTPRLAFVLGLATLSLGSVWGCAAVLGFEETTLRSDSDANLVEGGTVEGGTVEGGPLPDGGSSRLTTQPPSVIVRRGGTADLAVELARGSDVTGAVTIRLSALPTGVTATTATLAPGVDDGHAEDQRDRDGRARAAHDHGERRRHEPPGRAGAAARRRPRRLARRHVRHRRHRLGRHEG